MGLRWLLATNHPSLYIFQEQNVCGALSSVGVEKVSADQMDVESLNVSGEKHLKDTHCNGTTRFTRIH